MSKKTQIRLEPVSLNESTLETNIVSEIAALFRYPNGFSYPTRLRYFFDIPHNFPIPYNNKKVKIYRLTPTEEYHGGGWDSKIVIPNGNGTNRAIFIQFKSGRHSDGNNAHNSIFNLSLSNPNKHVEFNFNDNSNNNQHQTLKNLHDELVRQGLPSKSVIYGFPRITDIRIFDKLEEDLLLHTTFLSISEMDTKASANGINLYDSQVHHFRTCYFDERKKEIASTSFTLGQSKDTSGLLYEILLVRFAHWRNQFAKEIPIDFLNEEFYFLLADFLRVNPFKLIEFEYFRPYPPPFERGLTEYYSKLEDSSIQNFREIFGNNDNQQGQIAWRKDLFKKITEFVAKRHDGPIDILTDVPNDYSFSMSEKEALEIKVDKGTSYNLIVF